jgi:DNA-directed RNA polymerase specialized sigma24 family protein
MAIDWPAVMANDYQATVGVIRSLMPARLNRYGDAEDFVQMAIMDLLRRPEAFTGRNTLILIARRRMIDTLRLSCVQRHGGTWPSS